MSSLSGQQRIIRQLLILDGFSPEWARADNGDFLRFCEQVELTHRELQAGKGEVWARLMESYCVVRQEWEQ